MKETNYKTQKRIARIKLAAVVLCIVAIPCYAYFFHPEWIALLKSPRNLCAFVGQYNKAAMPIFAGLNVLQVVCSLPGQVFHIAGGYLFGGWIALPLAFAGVTIGSSIAYLIAHTLGHDAVHTLFGEKKVGALLEQVNSKKGIIILFVGYLIPGMPKDLLNYVAGLSDIKYKAYIIICMLGRLPGMAASIFVGNQLTQGQYTSAIIVGVCVLAACGLCLILRHKLIALFERFYDRFLG